MEKGVRSRNSMKKIKLEFHSLIDNFSSNDDNRLKEYDQFFLQFASLNRHTVYLFKSYITKMGNKYITEDMQSTKSNSDPSISLTLNLIHLHQNMIKIAETQFNDKVLCNKEIKEAFVGFINRTDCVYHVPISMAKFSDNILKKGSKITMDLKVAMDYVVLFYSFLECKGI